MAAHSPNLAVQDYAQLRKLVHEALILGQQRIEAARVLTYWRTGWYIRAHVALQGARAERYGARVVARLGRELDVHESVLRRCVYFVERLPRLFAPEEIHAGWHESPDKPLLTWSHYRALLTVADASRREALLREATRRGWTAQELEARIRRGARAPQEPLIPRRGTPGLFRIKALADALYWDLGFEAYRALSAADARRFTAGDLVRLAADGSLAPAPDAHPEELYAYEARVLRVVDGDTLWLLIRLAGGDWRREKLRLRGVDCPELHTSPGVAAKRFVEAQVQRAERLRITTTKPDQWDRYLSDVFLFAEGEVVYLNNRLLETGRARRYEAVSPEDWES
jgi:endonuclease YncB( thermonuclease family)